MSCDEPRCLRSSLKRLFVNHKTNFDFLLTAFEIHDPANRAVVSVYICVCGARVFAAFPLPLTRACRHWQTPLKSVDLFFLSADLGKEAGAGIEPANSGFADRAKRFVLYTGAFF